MRDKELENVAGGDFGGSEHTTVVTDANYGSFIRSAPNVVVLFGVSWSNTCVRASEIIENCAAKFEKIRVGVFEVTNSELLMYKLGIKNIPQRSDTSMKSKYIELKDHRQFQTCSENSEAPAYTVFQYSKQL